MHRFIFILGLVIISNIHFGQEIQNDSLTKSYPVSQNDTAVMQDVTNSVLDKEEADRNAKNLESFLQVQKKRDAKQKRNAIIRIGLGVLFLIILVIGLRRRNKKQQTG